MELDAYRSCSFAEKRQVLSVFWRSEPAPTSKIDAAAVQYGPWAVGFLIVIVLELLVLLLITVLAGHPAGWLALLPGALALFGLWRAIGRTRTLHSRATS
jgi:hypothetical protein